jgi:ATP-binding cassette subfamily F protein 3
VLGSAGFGATLADSQCATLSGGEKARLLFLLATWHAPHVLILDEPTNHLDMDSREALIRAINDYEGAVILVAHDRHIVETCADRLLLVDNNTAKPFDGDLDDYAELVLAKRRAMAPQPLKAGTVTAAAAPDKPRARSIRQVQRLIADADARMAKAQQKIALLDQALSDHTIYGEEPLKAADFVKLRTRIAEDLARDEELWLTLNEELVHG